ncbi:MAG: NAD-dependent epimerase/dehydratase family protein [Luteitalea sp.]|nr:NAD-dependent epimerase/dehydratase family protein [Luteitalea sp.]
MNIFVTGASGYIGGAVARRLVAAGHQVTGLVRSSERAEKLRQARIVPILGSLDDDAALGDAARAADAVIDAADADHTGAVEALTQALAGSGKPFIHTSGSSIVGDRAAGEPSERVYAEDTPLTPVPEKEARIAIDRCVIDAASQNIRAIVIVPTMIYGNGSSIQVPALIEQSIQAKAGVHVGRGLNRWSNVHIDDLADVYLLALDKASPGETFYVGASEATLRDIAAAISRMLGFDGRTVSWTLEEAVRVWGVELGELALGNNSRVSSEKARRVLGWQPRREDILADIERGSYAARPGLHTSHN